ncbi:MAG: UDP-N-acetylmuramate dehydrogenase [Syntrophobacteria bacterium]
MNPETKKELQRLDGLEVDWNVPLAGHTSMRVGGPVSCLLRPLNLAGLRSAVQVLNYHHFPYFVLGRGSNILVSDSAIRAAAISLECGFSWMRRLDCSGTVKAGAGLRLNRLLRFCLHESLSGFEFIAGIPGSVGGALCMNAGSNAGSMADICRDVVLLLPDGSLSLLSRDRLRFFYRRLELPPGAVLLEATFSFTPGSRKQIRQQVRALLTARKASQPWRLRSAGCAFKNPPGDFAGRLIEQAGLKGVRIGDAQISPLHANFIVNLGQARARDVLELIKLARETVFQRFGIHLELEIRVIADNSLSPDQPACGQGKTERVSA